MTKTDLPALPRFSGYTANDLSASDRREILGLFHLPPPGNMPEWLTMCKDMKALGFDEYDYLAKNREVLRADGTPYPDAELLSQWNGWHDPQNSGTILREANQNGWRSAEAREASERIKMDRELAAHRTSSNTAEPPKTAEPAPAADESEASESDPTTPTWRDEARRRIALEIPKDGGAKARELAERHRTEESQLGEGEAYLASRGLTAETIAKFPVGYCQHYHFNGTARPRCIIFYPGEPSPYWVARATEKDVPPAERALVSKSEVVGCHRLFNAPALTCGAKMVFIMEGEIDAMSIEQMGGAAVACKTRLELLAAIERAGAALTARTLIMIPDRDQNEAGDKYAATVCKTAREAGLEAYIRDLPAAEHDGKPLKDANDFLRFAPNLLRRWMAEAPAWLEGKRREGEGWTPTRLAAMSGDAWSADLLASADRGTPALPTGFSALDKLLGGGLRPGLYIIGAPPGAGKTTLALQISDHLAAEGHRTLFFSCEMEPQAIAAKTLARMTWDGVPNPAPGTLPQNMRMPNPAPWTPTEIMYMNSKGEASDRLLDDARTRHERWSRNVTIIPHEAAGTPTQIVDTLAAYTRIMGRPACVVIDYLQRLTPDRPADDTKKFLDSACRALALAAHGQDTKTVIVLIASLNREANKAAKITLESFSGSAGIGYEADCALGLREVADNGEAPRDDDALATLAARPLRRYKLQVLKARMGEAGAADLYLYGRAGRFVDARADAIEEIDWKRA